MKKLIILVLGLAVGAVITIKALERADIAAHTAAHGGTS